MQSDLHDIAKIMGVDAQTLGVLPKIEYEGNLLNPWGDELLHILSSLPLPSIKTVLDIPCGQGGVSVYWAKEYGVTVDGYDLFEGFVERANEYAVQNRVGHLCRFSAADIRGVVEKSGLYDLLLWSAPPHLWKDYGQTVGNLRNCVRDGGYIVIADAYVYSQDNKAIQPDYETLEETQRSVAAHGDSVVNLTDYRDTLWAQNYQTDREAIGRAINSCKDQVEREILERYLENVNETEPADMENLGLFILVLQVNKRSCTP